MNARMKITTQVNTCRTCSPLRTAFLALSAILACTLSFPRLARGAQAVRASRVSASTVPGELQVGVTYILWIPEGVSRLRGLIVHQHGAGLDAAKHGAAA